MLRGHAPGRSSDLPYWSVVSWREVKRLNGWLAGPCVGYEVHHVGTSRPCLVDVTSGEVPCPLCGAGIGREWRGYVPIWDELLTRRVVLIGERYYHLVEKVHHLQPVMARKLVGEWGQPVCVQRSPWTTDTPTLRDADRKVQDLGDWLIQMWNVRELNEWAAVKASITPPVPDATSVTPDVSPMNRAADVRAELTAQVLKKTRRGKEPTLLSDLLPAETNGKHKGKP
jgi:hypothetical protein